MKQQILEKLQKAAGLLNSSVIFDELADEYRNALLKAKAAEKSARLMAEFNAALNELNELTADQQSAKENNLPPVFNQIFKPFLIK